MAVQRFKKAVIERTLGAELVYLALAVRADGVFTDLKTRGCQDILIAVTDGGGCRRGGLGLGRVRARTGGAQFPMVVASWRRAWAHVIPFFAFPPEIRRVIHTTNALESVNARLRTILKTRGHAPHDDAAIKLMWLAIRNITATWGHPAPTWQAAMIQCALRYEGRFRAPSA